MSKKDNKKTTIIESVFMSFPHLLVLENLPGIQNILEDSNISSADKIIEKYLIVHDLSNKISLKVFTEAILKCPRLPERAISLSPG